MSVVLWSILFFAMIPAGIALLVIGVRMVSATWGKANVADVSFAHPKTSFTITEPGSYSIWIQIPMLKRIDLFRYTLAIRDDMGRRVRLMHPAFSMKINSVDTQRREIYRFDLREGTYELEIAEDPGARSVWNAAGASDTYVQIKRSTAYGWLLLQVLLLVVGLGSIIVGFVLGLKAPQLFG